MRAGTYIMGREVLTPREARIRREIESEFAECSRLGTMLDGERRRRFEEDDEDDASEPEAASAPEAA